MSALELVVAEALAGAGLGAALLAGLDLPHLDRLGARAGRARALETPRATGLTTWQAWLLRHQPGVNIAQLWWHALGQAPDAGAAALWLAEPVRFEVGLDQVALADPAELALSVAHAEALAASARPILARAGWTLALLTPRQWLLGAPEPLALSGATIECASGRDIVPFLPSGDAGAQRLWRGAHNEIQMTWFEHDVNRQRESAGALPINGLWLSGNGQSALAALPYRTIESELAYLGRAPRTPAAQRSLETFTGLIAPARAADWFAYRAALAALEARIGVHLAALGAGALERLELVFTGEGEIRQFILRRSDLWRFWRRGSAARLWRAPA